MTLHVFERPLPGPDAQDITRDIASRTGLPSAEISKVLDQEGFYIRGHGSPADGVVRLQAEDEVNWIAERLRIKRNRVRAILESYSDYLRERGLIPQSAV
jgi:hypothetical protein